MCASAPCKLLCASCSRQVALRELFFESCFVQAIVKLLCASARSKPKQKNFHQATYLRKEALRKCSTKVALLRLLCSSTPCRLLCKTSLRKCAAQVLSVPVALRKCSLCKCSLQLPLRKLRCAVCFAQVCTYLYTSFSDTVEALNIASATNAHVDTISVASPAACGPLSPSYNVEAKPVTRLPRPNILQVQHCIRGRGATDIMSQCFPEWTVPFVFLLRTFNI